jgi:hypothetical protein
MGRGLNSMEDFEKIFDFNIELDQKIVFHLIDCHEDSPIYDEVNDEYRKIENRVMKSIEPKAFYKFGDVSQKMADHSMGTLKAGSRAIFVLMTIGDNISTLSKKYFSEGDYLLGMLVNAMADSYLFKMDDVLRCRIKASCLDRHFGIERRLDAPSEIPMQVQKDILDEIKAKEQLPIDVTEGYMFTTVKTMGYILTLTKDETIDQSGHNCSTCGQINCKLRKA